MAKTIDSFQGQYRFLSNFYPCVVKLDGVYYPTVEHAYQAAKFNDADRGRFQNPGLKPGEAKALGRGKAPQGWMERSLEIMLALLRQKFAEPKLKDRLLYTGEAKLVEGNYWHDVFYGVCDGQRCRYAPHEPTGDNNLGKLLMKVRQELLNGEDN